MTTQRHVHHPPHLYIWAALALSLLVLLISCPVRGAGPASPPEASWLRRIALSQPPAPNGVFRVAVLKRGAWVFAGESAHSQFMDVGQVELRGLTIGDPIRVRITTQAPGAAHLDVLLLDGRPPIAARNALLGKLSAPDHDLTNTHNRTIEVTFVPRAETSATLTLLGRIEPKAVSATPFLFPPKNQGQAVTAGSAAYTYKLGDRPGRLTVNGELDEEHLPSPPLFAERVQPGSGHPEGATYGWVTNDSKTLYVAIDFTPDNTYDADQDYATTYARVNGAWRQFRVDASQRKWGRSGFTYTNNVPYEHKVYEFAIPLSELGLADAPKGTAVQLAFAAYGTASPEP